MDFLPEVGNFEDLLLKSSEKKKVTVFFNILITKDFLFLDRKNCPIQNFEVLEGKTWKTYWLY